jgi:hypothetical protein
MCAQSTRPALQAALQRQRDEDDELLSDARVATWHAEVRAKEEDRRLKLDGAVAESAPQAISLSEAAQTRMHVVSMVAGSTTAEGAGDDTLSTSSAVLVSDAASEVASLIGRPESTEASLVGYQESMLSDGDTNDPSDATEWQLVVASTEAAAARRICARILCHIFYKRYNAAVARAPQRVVLLEKMLRGWAMRRRMRQARAAAIVLQAATRRMFAR